MPRKKNPNSVSNYFNDEVEKAILDYNVADNQIERDRLFRIIYKPLCKIAEVMYNKIKPTYTYGDPLSIQMDCIAFMTERLHFIREGKGKAFSYMTVTARNFYIQENMRGYSDTKKILQISELPERFDIPDDNFDRVEEMEMKVDLLNSFATYIKENANQIFKTTKSKQISMDIVELIQNIENIEDFNHRNLMNGLYEKRKKSVDRHLITNVTNKLATHYVKFKSHYNKTGQILPFEEKNDLTNEEIEFCIKNYVPADRKLGIIAFSKKFSVDQSIIRKYLYRYGVITTL
jgi:hypothetical protein